jgi:hypothetical protein
MLENDIKTALRAHPGLMALLGNQPGRVDLVDVAQGTAVPYLTFNVIKSEPLGRGNLCVSDQVGPLISEIFLTPWAPDAVTVDAINTQARAALAPLKARFVGFRQWAREPQTNLLTRGQVLAVQHTE